MGFNLQFLSKQDLYVTSSSQAELSFKFSLLSLQPSSKLIDLKALDKKVKLVYFEEVFLEVVCTNQSFLKSIFGVEDLVWKEELSKVFFKVVYRGSNFYLKCSYQPKPTTEPDYQDELERTVAFYLETPNQLPPPIQLKQVLEDCRLSVVSYIRIPTLSCFTLTYSSLKKEYLPDPQYFSYQLDNLIVSTKTNKKLQFRLLDGIVYQFDTCFELVEGEEAELFKISFLNTKIVFKQRELKNEFYDLGLTVDRDNVLNYFSKPAHLLFQLFFNSKERYLKLHVDNAPQNTGKLVLMSSLATTFAMELVVTSTYKLEFDYYTQFQTERFDYLKLWDRAFTQLAQGNHRDLLVIVEDPNNNITNTNLCGVAFNLTFERVRRRFQSEFKFWVVVISTDTEDRLSYDYDFELKSLSDSNKCNLMVDTLQRYTSLDLRERSSQFGSTWSTQNLVDTVWKVRDSTEPEPILERMFTNQNVSDMKQDVSVDDLEPLLGMDEICTELIANVRAKLFPTSTPSLASVKSHTLLYGPPGTGKTLLLKHLIHHFSNHQVYLKTLASSDLIDSKLGRSEQNLINLFHELETNQPSLLLFDECESCLSVGTHSSQSQRRVLLCFLFELYRIKNEHLKVYLVLSTNFPNKIHPSTFGWDRVENWVYLGLPDSNRRLEVVQGKLNGTVDLDLDLLDRLVLITENYSNADLNLITEKICQKVLELGHVTQHLLEEVVNSVTPSVDQIEWGKVLKQFLNFEKVVDRFI